MSLRLGKIIIALLLCGASSGCAIIDNVESRATALNSESAETKSATVLTNILRAAYSEPLQFTEIVSYSGQNSGNFQMGSSLPIAVVPSTLSRTFSISPSIQASGSNQFQISNLNNMEFYYGPQTPISMQMIALFLKAGYEPRILLPLIISDIEVQNNDYVSQWHGNAISRDGFTSFYTALGRLIDEGLFVEEVQKVEKYGPELNKRDATYLLGKLLHEWKDEAPELKKLKNGRYQIQKTKKRYRICFDRLKKLGQKRYHTTPDLIAAPDAALEKSAVISLASPKDKILNVEIKKEEFCRAKAEKDENNNKDDDSLERKLKFTTRSPQGVFQFLGEMVRTELGIAADKPTSLAMESNDHSGYFRLFSVNNPDGGDVFTSITFKGRPYHLSSDPSGTRDASTRVLQIAQDLVALQSSAKNFPTPNVITVLGQ
jgi:hypothetical protein